MPRLDDRGPGPRTIALWVLALLVLAAGAGALWAALASPASWQVTDQGVVLTEAAATGQVGVELLYDGIGVVLCAVWGVAAGVRLRRVGWRIAPVVALACVAAALLAWQVGLLLGPPDPATVAAAAEVGDTIEAQLSVDARASFLVWPIAGLAGLLLATAATDRRPATFIERSEPAPRP